MKSFMWDRRLIRPVIVRDAPALSLREKDQYLWILQVPLGSPESAAELFAEGMRHAAQPAMGFPGEEAFELSILEMAERLAVRLQVPVPRIRFEEKKGVWGLCSKGGIITLHPSLQMEDADVAEEVLLHEMIHLMIPNHARAFWERLTLEDPWWPEKEGRLRERHRQRKCLRRAGERG
ncbi:MAG: M48 family metallopeptidase [Clostridia bacterium]|nr:M48 family metallopeptidase [Clostridia bacterium]